MADPRTSPLLPDGALTPNWVPPSIPLTEEMRQIVLGYLDRWTRAFETVYEDGTLRPLILEDRDVYLQLRHILSPDARTLKLADTSEFEYNGIGADESTRYVHKLVLVCDPQHPRIRIAWITRRESRLYPGTVVFAGHEYYIFRAILMVQWTQMYGMRFEKQWVVTRPATGAATVLQYYYIHMQVNAARLIGFVNQALSARYDRIMNPSPPPTQPLDVPHRYLPPAPRRANGRGEYTLRHS